MRRLAVFTLVALAPSYIVTSHGGRQHPPGSSGQLHRVTYVSTTRHVRTNPIPALRRPDVSDNEGNV